MARARNIKPALFKNELLGVADPLLTLLFQSLWTLADKEGRLEDRPLRIKAETFPYREGLDINGYLTELQRLGFIVRYSVGEMVLIQVVNFKKHQTPHNTEKPSEFPPVEAGIVAACGLRDTSVKSPLSNGENVDALPPDSGFRIPDSPILIPDLLNPSSLIAERVPVARGSRLPENFEPDFEFAVGEGIQNTLEEAHKFRDYWNSIAGQKGVKLDWQATWRNWCRNAKSAPGAYPNRPHVNKQEALEARNREIGRAWAAGETSGTIG